MIDRQEKEKEILQALMVVAEQYRAGPTEMSFRRNYVPRIIRLFERDGIDIFRAIASIPGEYREFPSASELENHVRETMGLTLGKGLNRQMIERNTESLIRGGYPPEAAEKSKRFVMKILGERGIAAPLVEPEKEPAPSLESLGDFEEKEKNLLDDLGDF